MISSRIRLASLACVSILATLSILMACDEPPSAGGPPKIFRLIAPTEVDAGADVTLMAAVDSTAAFPLTVKWQVAGPGRILPSEYQLTAPSDIASGDLSDHFQAPALPGRTTVQLTLENGAGFDQAEATIQTGYEDPYLSSLTVIGATGQEQPIDVPELGPAVLVHPGDQFSLVAQAIDYNGLPLSYSWSLNNDYAITGNCSSAGGAFDLVSGTDGPQIALVAPKLFCSTQLNLSLSNGKSTWQSTVATLQVAAIPPQVNSVVSPSTVGPGQTITLSADVTYDPTTSIKYNWSLHDVDGKLQGSSSDATASFVLLDAAQSYYACLDVTDGYGQTGSNCIDLVVPSDWQLEGTLSPTSYINVPDSNSVDSITINDSIVLERLDRATKQVSVINAIPNEYGTNWNNLLYAAGGYFGVAEFSTVVQRLEAPSLSKIESPQYASLFAAAGKLWKLAAGNSSGSWQYLQGDAWQTSGQFDQFTSTEFISLQAVVGRDDGQFLVLSAGSSSSALLECDVAGGCQSLGTIGASINTSVAPVALGWASDGRAIVLQGLNAWRHDTLGWVSFTRNASGASSPVLAMGDGQACQAVQESYSSYHRSVWCLGEQGWGLIGLANIGNYCSKVALAVAQGTAHFACDGKLYSHLIALP